MINTIINSLVAGVLGVIAFVIVKQIVAAQDTTSWTGAETAVIGVVPTVIAIVVIVGMFMGLTRIRGAGGEM